MNIGDHAFKIIVAGASGTGKSCFILRHLSGEFERRHIPTLGCEVHPITLHTTRGRIIFYMWDLAGAKEFAGLGEGYYQNAQGIIVFYDLTVPDTMTCALDILDKHKGLASVLCGNKADLLPSDSVVRPRVDIPFYYISARSNYNFEKPFLSLARQLLGDDSIEFTESPAITPPTVSINETRVGHYPRLRV